MAESRPSLGRSILIGSDQVPDSYCEPCHEVNNKVKPVAGYCKNCDENLCLECFTSHLGPKLFRNHKLFDKSTRPKTPSTSQTKHQTKPKMAEECLQHQGETIHAYCHSHSNVICQICLTIDHETCHTEEISRMARNIADSQDLRDLNQKLSTLKKGFKDNQSKTGAKELIIQRNHSDAINDMKKLRDEFDKLMTETEKQADNVKAEDFTKIEKVSATCEIVVKQINKLTTQLETLQENNATQILFIAMKRAEKQIPSLEDKFEKLNKDKTVREYEFVPDEKLKAVLNDLKQLGQLSFLLTQNVSMSAQKAKRPNYVKNITVTSSSKQTCNVWGSLVLSNKQILITDGRNKKLKLINTNQNKIIPEVNLSGYPHDVTKVKADEVAVTVKNPNTIQFISVSQNSMSKVREVTVDGCCEGIAYNVRDKTLVVSFVDPPKIKILDMVGTEMKCIEHDSMGGKLFKKPLYVALSPSMTSFYVTDFANNSVTLMSLNGDVKAVYEDKTIKLQNPYGLCIHKSGVVYVVGGNAHTIHGLDPESGEFKVVLEMKDGLYRPLSISYCEKEDKMYIGMYDSSDLKVFQI